MSSRAGINLSGKRIFVTGHTGFTGSWASIWLQELGATVFGYALPPATEPSLFRQASLDGRIQGVFADLRDIDSLKMAMERFEPDLVLHLAAQPLVRESYANPLETFEINAQGTANVLEVARRIRTIKGILCITTDKVYANSDSGERFIESDRLGGKDPYSASKAAAEVIIASYRESFFNGPETANLAVARGGNIIGGGDWSDDRIIPDFVRAFAENRTLRVRNSNATRPWQHVISLVDGYLRILFGLLGSDGEKFSRAFNLGPSEEREVPVTDLLALMSKHFPDVDIQTVDADLPEAQKLALDSSIAREILDWQPVWSIEQTIEKTATWYSKFYLSSTPDEIRNLCIQQILEWNIQLDSKKESDI